MKMPPLRIAPSVLSCDFGRLADEVAAVESAGADWIHVDVMDGHFVPNLTVGPAVVGAIRRATRLALDVHLMVDDPSACLEAFLDAGADIVTVHVEASGLAAPGSLAACLAAIRARGRKPSVSMRPGTPWRAIEPVLDAVEMVLVMSVEPGFGGQAFLPVALSKIAALRERFAGDIEVDGGINNDTGRSAREAGANVLVAGTYIFRSDDYAARIASLRG